MAESVLTGLVEQYIHRLRSSQSSYRPLFSTGVQAICESLKICHCRSQIIEFWISRFGGRNFASGRQGGDT